MDDTKHQERLQQSPPPAGHSGILQTKEAEAEESRGFVQSVWLSARNPRPVRRGGVPFPGRQQHVVPVYAGWAPGSTILPRGCC